MFFFLIIVAFAIILLTVWHKRTYSYWSSRNVNGPKPYFLFGTIPHLIKKNDICTAEKELRSKYGKIFGEYFGTTPHLVVSDLKLATQILVTDFDIFRQNAKMNILPEILQGTVPFAPVHKWKRLRTTITPAFSTSKIRKSVEHLDKPMKNFKCNLDELIKKKMVDQICIADIVKCYAMDAILKYVFSIEVDSFRQRSEPIVENMWKLVTLPPIPFTLAVILPKWLSGILNPWMVDNKAAEFYSKMSFNIIQQRKANPQVKYNDFLDFLLESSFDLTDREQSDHCLVVFVGAIDTVTKALSIILSDLAIRPDIQQKLLTEIYEKLDGEELTYDKINELEYLNGVVMESMRKTSPVNRLMRHPSRDYQLPGTDIVLKKGTTVWINAFNIHHDPEIYPQPYEFRPERFMGEEKQKRPACAWLPFSGGSRNCAGFRFALIELKYFLIKLIRDYEVQLSKNCKLPISYGSGIILSIPEDLKVNFIPRNV